MGDQDKRRSGPANSFDRKYLEANLVGTEYKGSKIIAVSNKYIHTENEAIIKKGHRVSFEHKEGTEKYISPDTSGDTEGDQL